VHQHEKKVASLLDYIGLERFLPTVVTKTTWSDRIKVSDRPLITGYVFCRAARCSVGAILKTPGVNRILTFGGKLHPVSEEEIAVLQKLAAEAEIRSLCLLCRSEKPWLWPQAR
jgi:transcription antitermination factor NusG